MTNDPELKAILQGMLTSDDVAARWRVSNATLQRWADIDHGPNRYNIDGIGYYLAEEVDAFERASEPPNTGANP